MGPATKKSIAPECANEMLFVKPSHGDVPRAESLQQTHHTLSEWALYIELGVTGQPTSSYCEKCSHYKTTTILAN